MVNAAIGGQARQPVSQEIVRGGACPIGAPSRREGGWNPRVRSESNTRQAEFKHGEPSD